ncbi:MAG: hypothetical protein ACYTFG_16445, partial [Planctomycetota bacterium]
MDASIRIPVSAALAIMLLLASLAGDETSASENQDWPGWRGPKGTGITDDADWDPKALEGKLEFVWRKPVGEAFSGVTVKGKHLYTQGIVGQKPRVSGFAVFCFDADTGGE